MSAKRLAFVILAYGLWAQEEGVPVVIDGKEVVRVYGSVGSFKAADRAPQIEHRITTLGERGFDGKVTTRSIPSENATAIVAGAVLVMAITDADAQSVGVSRDELARKYADSIQQTIAQYRERHSWSSFLIDTLKALIAATLFCVSAWALWRAIRWLGQRLERSFQNLAAAREAKRFHLLMWERGRILFMMGVKFAAVLALISEFSFVVSYVLGLFPQTAGISTTLLDYLGRTFGRVGTAVVDYLPSGGFVIIAALLTRYVLRILRFVMDAVENGDLTIRGLHPEMAKPTYQLVRMLTLLFALVVVFPFLPGGKSEAFKGVSIFLGLLLSLGSSSAVSNVLAGLVLTYMRPFHSGDRVKIADTTGDIIEKTLLVTRLRTIKNVEVVIPNSAILNSQILNYSALARTRGLIMNTSVTIGYDVPWRTVHGLLIHAALGTEGILADPLPFVLETALNDSYVTYELNAYTDRANDIQNIYSHLHEAIQDSFNEAAVEIMSPSFYALRDGNTVTIPKDHRPSGYQAPAFRVTNTGSQADTGPDTSGHVLSPADTARARA